jgi:hypothetical protein
MLGSSNSSSIRSVALRLCFNPFFKKKIVCLILVFYHALTDNTAIINLQGSGEETRGAETIRNFRKDAPGRPCNCNGSCASQEVPPRLLRLASGPHGLVECSRLLLHLKGGHRLFNVCTTMSSLLSKNNNAESHLVQAIMI